MEQNYNINTVASQTSVKQFNKGQISILSWTLLIAGVGFILVGVIGWLTSYIVNHAIAQGSDATMMGLTIGFVVLLLTSQIMALFAYARIERLSKITIGVIISFYCLGMGIGFGLLFSMLTLQYGLQGIYYIALAFAIGGLCFLVSALISKVLSNRAYIGFGKFVMFLSLGYFAIFGLMMILFIVSIFVPSMIGTLNNLYLLGLALSTLLFFFYMILDLATIRKMSAFIQAQESKVAWNFIWMLGFKLLMDLVGLVYNILIIMLRTSR